MKPKTLKALKSLCFFVNYIIAASIQAYVRPYRRVIGQGQVAPEFENRRKREIAEKEKSRAKRAGKKQKRMHESKDLSKNRAINLIFLQKSVDKREDILYNYRST